MKIVIDISEKIYNQYVGFVAKGVATYAQVKIANGTPLSKGCGDLIDANALKQEFDIIASNSATDDWQTIPIRHIKQIIDSVPTVIKADKENKE